MSATVRLERRMVFVNLVDRNRPWQVRLDGEPAGSIASDDVLELPVAPGPHTLQLTSTGRRCSPTQSFEARDESIVEFTCHPQPVWPLVLMAFAVPGRWIMLKKH